LGLSEQGENIRETRRSADDSVNQIVLACDGERALQERDGGMKIATEKVNVAEVVLGDEQTRGMLGFHRDSERVSSWHQRVLEVPQGRIRFRAPRAEAYVDRQYEAGLRCPSIRLLEQGDPRTKFPHRLRDAPEIATRLSHDELRIAPCSQVIGVRALER